MATAEYQREWKLRNSGKQAEYTAKYRRLYPERERDRSLKWKKDHPSVRSTEATQRMVTVSSERKRLKREALAGRPRPDSCEICGAITKSALSWDHDHQTGLFRDR